MPAQTTTRQSWLSIVGWAMFLACSWTWCIGMFLPILFLRDFGPWSFVVFAAPNVIGAAAFGWVFARPGVSTRFLARHRIAVRFFAQITIAFQLYFMLWLWTGVPGLGAPLRSTGPAGALVWVGVLAAVLTLLWPARPQRRTAAVLWTFSAAALLWWTLHANPDPAPIAHPQAGSLIGLIFTAPIVVFGFLLCPAMDPTFHQARQGCTHTGSRWAFSLGFGVFFLAMILGTIAYAPLVLDPPVPSAPITLAGAIITLHIIAQLLITIRFQQQADERLAMPGDSAITLVGVLVLILSLAGILASVITPGPLAVLGSLTITETIYRVFMSFYGLAFPAYVWICVIPARDGSVGPTRLTLRIWALAVGIAAPMFWVGYILGYAFMLPAGLIVVLLARLALPGGAGLPRRSHQPA